MSPLKLKSRLRGAALFALAGAVLLLLLTGTPFFKTLALIHIENAVRLQASAKHAGMDLLTGKVSVRSLVLMNPRGFPRMPMFEISSLEIDLNMPLLLIGRVQADSMTVAISRINLVRNERRVLNLHALPAGAKDLAIKKLRLILDEIVYRDYAAGGDTAPREYPGSFKAEYSNVEGLAEAAEILGQEIFAGPENTETRSFRKPREEAAVHPSQTAANYVGGAVTNVQDTAKAAAGAMGEGIRETALKISSVFFSLMDTAKKPQPLAEVSSEAEGKSPDAS